jgi:hypothetical protein
MAADLLTVSDLPALQAQGGFGPGATTASGALESISSATPVSGGFEETVRFSGADPRHNADH